MYNTLQNQIDSMSKSIKTDSYPMSIGELAGLYKEGDLDINPIYQRLFRWDIDQQSTLIESLLLQIPIPPIYVYQSEDGKWSVIDGQQRLSTIFKFMCILKKPHERIDDEDNAALYEREPLTKTRFLPALEGKYWQDDNPEKSLTEAQRRYIKRAKILIIIIDKSSDSFAQYEMFQRLNTGGSHLSPQEIRNCVLVMTNEPAYHVLKEMSKDSIFQKSVPISEKEAEEQGYTELVVKFFILKYSKFEVSDSENYNDFLTDEMLVILNKSNIDFESDKKLFKRIFGLLYDTMDENAFKKYDEGKKRHIGPVLVGAYEAIIPGLIEYIDYYDNHKEELKRRIDRLYVSDAYQEATKRGIRPITRMKRLVHTSKELLNVEEDKNN